MQLVKFKVIFKEIENSILKVFTIIFRLYILYGEFISDCYKLLDKQFAIADLIIFLPVFVSLPSTYMYNHKSI